MSWFVSVSPRLAGQATRDTGLRCWQELDAWIAIRLESH